MPALSLVPADTTVLDSPARWRLDGAILGGLSTAGLVALMIGSTGLEVLTLTAASLLVGAAGGGALRGLLDRLRGRLSLWLISLCVMVLGGLWGWATMALCSAIVERSLELDSLLLAGVLCAPVGAVLLGLLWLPYAMTAVLRWPRWPVMLLTLVTSTATCWLWLEFLLGRLIGVAPA